MTHQPVFQEWQSQSVQTTTKASSLRIFSARVLLESSHPPARGCTFDLFLLCIIETNLSYSHIRLLGLHCVQLPTASQINLLLNLFSFLVSSLPRCVTRNPNTFLMCTLSCVEVRPRVLFAVDILHISVISFYLHFVPTFLLKKTIWIPFLSYL
jgi:hypothetical protein